MFALTDIFLKICHIFKNTPSHESRFSQLSWETLAKQAHRMPVVEYKESTTDTQIIPPT